MFYRSAARTPLQAGFTQGNPARARIVRLWQSMYLPRSGRQIEFMRFGSESLRPVVWLHSVEYPMSAPWGVCIDAAERGYGIISVRRPGFGGSSPAASTDEEVADLSELMTGLGIGNAVLIAEGTSRPAGLKLASDASRIAFTVLARPAYMSQNFADTDQFMRDILLQAIQSPAGARLAMLALQQLARRNGHAILYGGIFKSASDQSFLKTHERDLDEAWACLSAIKADTFRRELHALLPDPGLTEGALSGVRGVAVIGADTQPVWRNGFLAQSTRLGIESAVLPKGSMYALHQNFDAVLDLVEARA